MKAGLQKALKIPVYDGEVEELFEFHKLDLNGIVSIDDFIEMY